MTATPAAELRQAAQRLRELAQAATEGPWFCHDTHLDQGGHTATVMTERHDPNATRLVAWLPTWSHEPWTDGGNAWNNATYMAAMHPLVAVALADWLEQAAKAADAAVIAARNVWGSDEPEARDQWIAERADQHALVVARQILGTRAEVAE